MASTYSTSLKLELIGNGDQSGVWGTTTNKNLGTLLEQAITGVQSIEMTNRDYTLTNFNGTSDEARNAVLVVTGTNDAIWKIIAPLVKKTYIVYNNTTGGQSITIGGATGNAVTIPNGVTTSVYCNGTNFFNGFTGLTGNFIVNGNVGIGDITPDYKLTVADTGADHQLWVRNTGTAASDDAIILVTTSSTGTTSTISGLYFGDGDSNSIGRLNYNHSNNSMAFFTNSTEQMRITSAGRVGIGTDSPSYKLDVYDASTAYSALRGDSNTQFIVQRSSADATGGFVQFYKSRGTVAAPTIVSNDDITGRVVFYGYDGASFTSSAEVRGSIDAATGADDMPGRLTFYTTPNGSATLTERMRISSTGLVSIAANGGLSIDATDVTGTPAATVGNVFSGTYTPTLTNVTNIPTGGSATGNCQYMRVGNVVTVSGLLSINPTAIGDIILRMTLPIASNFSASSRNCAGTFAAYSNNYGEAGAILGFSSATGQAEFRASPTSASDQDYAFSFTYRIV
jgi:hypothetical protein